MTCNCSTQIENFQHYLHIFLNMLCTKKEHCTILLEPQFKLLSLMQYSLQVLRDLNISVVSTCLYILHLVLPHDRQQPFLFSRGATFCLTRLPFKFLALLRPITLIFSKTFPCYLPGANSKCILDSTFFKFRKHWIISNIKNKPTFISISLLFKFN